MVNVMNIYDDYELNRLTLEDDFKDSSDFLLKEIITGNPFWNVKKVLTPLCNNLNISKQRLFTA